MTAEDHILGLGKIIANLHALEYVLRIFLCEANSEMVQIPLAGTIQLLKTHLTNYDSLGVLIDKYNASLSANENKFRINREVVRVRDAIAHGRAASESATFPLSLYNSHAQMHKRKLPQSIHRYS